MKRKYLTVALAAVMVGTLFVGCGKKDVASSGSGEKIQITYINWNLATEEENNLERRMIEEYEKRNPDIDIVIADYIDTSDYANSLTTAAAGGKLPDVLALQNIPSALSNEWLMDITEFTTDDEDWNKISKPVIESTKYGEGTYAVPSGQFLAGYFVNKDLFESENIKQPETGYTFEELETAIKSINKPNKNIIGLGGELQMLEWYPSLTNDNLGWYTFDGEKYNVNDPSFKEGILKANELTKNGYVYDSLPQDQKDKFSGTNEDEVWLQGEIAVRYDGTWSAPNYNKANFEYEFIGLPNNKNVIINDYMGISKTSKHAQEAYDFAKWMSFSKEGTLARIEIGTENDLSWGSLPILNDNEVNEKYFAWNNINGVLEAYENLDNSLVEGVKVIPGYLKSRWEAPTGVKVGDKENANISDVIFDMVRGTTNVEDYLTQINDLANQNYVEANEAVKAIIE